jgi:NADPH:quinone reductase-like Zn-dependent oxidoreductase
MGKSGFRESKRMSSPLPNSRLLCFRHGTLDGGLNYESESRLLALKPGELRVRMTLCPINAVDTLMIKGRYPSLPALPFVPGYEGVGYVSELGPGTNNRWIGQRIVSTHWTGTWQEQSTVKEEFAVAVPDSLSDPVAAQSMLNPLSAWLALTYCGSLKPKERLGLNGGNSRITRIFVQLGHLLGAETTVFGVGKELQKDLTELGAETHPCYPQLGKEESRRVDLAIDLEGGTESFRLAQTLKPGGLLVGFGGLSGHRFPYEKLVHELDDIRLSFFLLGYWIAKVSIEERQSIAKKAFEWLNNGKLVLPKTKNFPMSDFANALKKPECLGYRNAFFCPA